MCWLEDDGWAYLRTDNPVARKQHRCAEGCRIEPGERYLSFVGISEGSFEIVKMCTACRSAAQLLGTACRRYEEWSSDPPIGLLLRELDEHLDNDELLETSPPEELAALEQARVQLRERAH